MSAFNIRNIREISNDPLTKFTNTVARKLARFLTKDQVESLEDNEDIYSNGQDIESVVRLHDELQSQKKFLFATEYYPPAEPDADKVRCWIQGNNMGNEVNDISGYEMHGELNGDPMLVAGDPFDYGIHTQGVKSVALRFNRSTSPFVNQEFIRVPNSTNLDQSGTAMSYFIRFRVSSIASQSGSNRTLFCKIDDSTPTHGVMVQITPTGRLTFHITDESVNYDKQTPGSTIAVNTVYDVWFVYTVSGNAFKIYVNGVDQTLTDVGSSPSWHADGNNHDLSIFRKGEGSSNGFVEGDLYDFLIYKAKTVSQTEVTRHYTNKWTTADIPFGQVMVSNYWATSGFVAGEGDSFTTTSYTTTSFNT